PGPSQCFLHCSLRSPRDLPWPRRLDGVLRAVANSQNPCGGRDCASFGRSWLLLGFTHAQVLEKRISESACRPCGNLAEDSAPSNPVLCSLLLRGMGVWQK